MAAAVLMMAQTTVRAVPLLPLSNWSAIPRNALTVSEPKLHGNVFILTKLSFLDIVVI